MNYRTVHENPRITLSERANEPTLDRPILLSTLWIAILLADALRGIHETVRPGFVDELAHEGTVYGNEVTDGILLGSGFVLVYIIAVVVLSRVLRRQANRLVNVIASLLMMAGVLASWPKDPDDLVFGGFQVAGALLVVVICARWRADDQSTS